MRGPIFVSIVSFESAGDIPQCLSALSLQAGFTPGETLLITVTDNASTDGSADAAERSFPGVVVQRNSANVGFAAGHNQAIQGFLESRSEFLLVLNPDVRLAPECLSHLSAALSQAPHCGFASPKLLRGDPDLEPLSPPVIDAAGMVLESSIRHLDRGSGAADCGQFERQEEVFGGTGACLLVRRRCVEEMLLRGEQHDADSTFLYPQLREGRLARAPFFDEAFFAYREDADIAWRGHVLGWSCLYVPSAVGVHRRRVTPERRSALPAELNRWSVRNRFLLQLNNLFLPVDLRMLIPGVLLRNLVVILGVCTVERSSFAALRDVIRLLPRALERRRILRSRRRKKS